MDFRYSAAGLLVGFLVGISGVGGSAILAPVLILFLGVKPIIAIGTDLVYSVPTKVLAAFVHWRAGNVDKRIVFALVAGGVPGVIAGLLIVAWVRAHVPFAEFNVQAKHWIGIAILLASAGALAAQFFARRESPPEDEPVLNRAAVVRLVITGFAVGWLVSMTSVGSGSVTLPLLMFALPRATLRRLIGSDIVYAACIIPVAAAGHSIAGDVDWRASASLLVGSLPGVYVGSKLCARINESYLRPVIVGVLVFAGSRLL
jgi:uncharacterized membrane protein YfcA